MLQDAPTAGAAPAAEPQFSSGAILATAAAAAASSAATAATTALAAVGA